MSVAVQLGATNRLKDVQTLEAERLKDPNLDEDAKVELRMQQLQRTIAAKKSDKVSIEALAETGRFLGIGLASLSPIFAPEKIVIGGGIAAAGEILLGPTQVSYAEHVGDEFRDSVTIAVSAFDGWEGMVGAASLALSAFD